MATKHSPRIRVHGVDNVGYLEDIADIDAGWEHSLALDVSGFVWALGNNFFANSM
jgi:alpha-tubulin suppressor-like RCC1 family protein